jgi:hypothetical protein
MQKADEKSRGGLGHRSSPANYSKLLEVSIRISMRGPALQNSIETAISAHLWPFKMDENCNAPSGEVE